MNCTAFGLITAVPVLVVHAYLQSKTMGLSDGLQTAAIRFLNALAARQAARAESRLELVKQAPQAASA
jgi:biopolymer transport protein ExbB